jgi:hypothetical protein
MDRVLREVSIVCSNPAGAAAPMVLTISEVMGVLRIGRTKAYEQARLFLETNGVEGLPCVRVGDSIRFLRHAIEELLGHEIVWPIPDPTDTDPPPPQPATTPETSKSVTKVNGRHAQQDPSAPRLFSV